MMKLGFSRDEALDMTEQEMAAFLDAYLENVKPSGRGQGKTYLVNRSRRK